MKKMIALFLAAVMAFALCACGSSPASTATDDQNTSSDKPLRFMSITGPSDNLSGIAMNNGAKEVIEAAGGEFTAQYYEEDASRMISMIENAVTAGYNGFILQALTQDAGQEVLRKAIESGMVIVEYDTDYQDVPEIQYCFSASNYDLGYMIGSAAGKWATENLVANGIDVIVGAQDLRFDEEFTKRSDGMIDGLMAECPSAQIVATGCAASLADNIAITENWLQANPDLNLVVSISDMCALGAAEALSAAGKDPAYTAVFATDATEEALKQIASSKGMFKGTVDLNLNGVGKEAAQLMLDFCNGVENNAEKYNKYPMVLVTKDNVAEYGYTYN